MKIISQIETVLGAALKTKYRFRDKIHINDAPCIRACHHKYILSTAAGTRSNKDPIKTPQIFSGFLKE